MTNGYQALRDGAGLLDMASRARLAATGEDRVRLLHALATNPVEGLAPGRGTETLFLSPQGRIQAHCRLYVFDDRVLLETSEARRQILLDYLERYIIMDDVTLEDVSAKTAAFAVEGPGAEAVARAVYGGVPDGDLHAHRRFGEATLFRSSLTGAPGLWVEVPAGQDAETRAALLAAGAVEASAQDALTVRVENRKPELDADYFDSNIPHETGQMHLISFTKGCYTGQEIVERVRSQGRVNRLLRPLEIDAETQPSAPDVAFEGRTVGQATSLVASPLTGKILGFAILRREAAEPGAALSVGGFPARTLSWPE